MLRCLVIKKNFNSTQNPWHFPSLPSLNLFNVENWKRCLVNVPSAKATVILKYVYGRTTHIYFFRPDKAIYNWKFVHRHPLLLDFCWHCCHILLGYNTRIRDDFLIPCFLHFLLFFLFTVLFGWMFAVEKYKLLLQWLVKIACTKLSYFVINSYGSFTFKLNASWNSETASISAFCCAYFLGTLQFCNKSFATWEDSNVHK